MRIAASHPGSVLIAAHRLVDRIRHGCRRANEVSVLRRRIIAAARSYAGQPALVALAEGLLRDRLHLAALLHDGGPCSGCARGHPLPAGLYPGGHCCSGRTEDLFDDLEVVALALGGVTPGSLRPASGDHAGCAFRGATGCTLPVASRPNRCLAYTCRELEAELRLAGAMRPLRRIRSQMMRRRRHLTQALATSALPAMQAP